MDGLALTRRIRDRRPVMPAIVITAYASARAEGEALDAVTASFLAKPFPNAELVDLVKRALPA
jgi:DNA-binding NtrC family response regulator